MASLTLYLVYPIIVGLCSFWFLEFRDNSIGNAFRYVGIDILLALVGITLGFLIGTYVKKDTSAILVLTAVIITMGLGAGVFVKVTPDSNWFIKGMTWISPMRYGNELLLRTMVFDTPIMSPIFTWIVGYDYGIPMCAVALSAFSFVFFMMTYMILLYRAS